MRWIFLTVLILLPIIAFAVSEADVIRIVEERIDKHSSETKWIMGIIAGAMLSVTAWFLKQIDNNRVRLDTMDNDLHLGFKGIRDQLNEHKLHVADHYTKDNKIEALVKHEISPLKEQLSVLQSTMNVLVTKITKP